MPYEFEATEPEDLNCDLWAEVDFGRGPVEVRCTLTSEHDKHVCIVEMVDGVDDVDGEVDPSMN